jgi:hypothetical protein
MAHWPLSSDCQRCGLFRGKAHPDNRSHEHLMPRVDENGNCRGPIAGLVLSPRAWRILRRENITTLGKLRAVAARLERFEGLGPVTARAIRAELARIASSGEEGSWSCPSRSAK